MTTDAKGLHMTDSNSREAPTSKRTGLAGAPLAVAVLAILVWIVFVVVMLVASDADETQWARMAYVFASVEAVAFAAAGALFGVTVQRDRVKSAEEKADAHARDAANGRALAISAIADGGHLGGQDDAYAFGPGETQDLRQRHAELARTLFPDLA